MLEFNKFSYIDRKLWDLKNDIADLQKNESKTKIEKYSSINVNKGLNKNKESNEGFSILSF